MRGILIIQGEGRGHISQALSYCENNPQIKIECIIISSQRKIPHNFFEDFGSIPIIELKSLNFVYDKGTVDVKKTIWKNLIRLPIFIKNLFIVRKWVKHFKPNIVINFYEPLSILSTTFLKPKKISIANQYLFYTNGWRYPSIDINYISIKFWNFITSIGSDQVLAPSFIKFPKNDKVKTIDPLIRKSIKKRTGRKGTYTLVYLIDEYLVKRFLEYAKLNKNDKFVLFCDSIEGIDIPENVKYMDLDPNVFVNKLVNCKKVICTAGFQLICEALYLNKEIEAIPLHYEQEINGYNLELHNLGKVSKLIK